LKNDRKIEKGKARKTTERRPSSFHTLVVSKRRGSFEGRGTARRGANQCKKVTRSKKLLADEFKLRAGFLDQESAERKN